MNRQVVSALVIAGAIIAGSAALAGAEAAGWLSGEFAERAIGVIIALVVVGYANVMPKRLVPADDANPARTQSRRRVAGWALALAGIGSAIAWIFAPFDYAAYVSMGVIATGLAVSFIYCFAVRGPRAV